MAGGARNTRTIKKPLDGEGLLPTYVHSATRYLKDYHF